MAESVRVQFKKLDSRAKIPQYMTLQAAGLDLCALLNEPLIVEPGQRVMVPTGLAMAIPAGFEGQVRPRSGLAWRDGITLVNTPGTIDADYRGEVKILLINHGQNAVTIQHEERIAQLIIAPVIQAELVEVDSLDATDRDQGGFGHTGKG
nr:dUTP diphosphatase [uncultured Desulfuromonas sp.]